LRPRKKPIGHKRYEDFNAFASFETKWRAKSACKNEDTSIFFAPSKSNEARKALAVCAKCPVKVECFYSSMIYQYHGIWGGFTQEARSSILSKLLNNDLSNFTFEEAQRLYADLSEVNSYKTKDKSVTVRKK